MRLWIRGFFHAVTILLVVSSIWFWRVDKYAWQLEMPDATGLEVFEDQSGNRLVFAGFLAIIALAIEVILQIEKASHNK